MVEAATKGGGQTVFTASLCLPSISLSPRMRAITDSHPSPPRSDALIYDKELPRHRDESLTRKQGLL